MPVFYKVLLLIILLIINGFAYGYYITCPYPSQRILRAQAICNNKFITNYQCLSHLYGTYLPDHESCTEEPEYAKPGEKIVFVPFHPTYHMNCREERYQPFRFWANVSSQCVLQKSKCNEIGQVIYYNGTLREDRLCRCDYTQGFAFVTEPQNRCYCNLSKEDCTCYKKQCSGLLTSDYLCTKNESTTYACPPIIDIKQDGAFNKRKDITKDRRGYRKLSSYPFNIICGILALWTAWIIFWFVPKKCRKIIDNRCMLFGYTPNTREWFIQEDENTAIIFLQGHSVREDTHVIQQHLGSQNTEKLPTSPSSGVFIFNRPEKFMSMNIPLQAIRHKYLREVSLFEKTEFIKIGFMDIIVDTNIHVQKHASIDNFRGLKKSLIQCNNYFVNCDVDRRLQTQISFSGIYSEIGSSGNQASDFFKLVFTSYHVNRKTVPSSFWINIFIPTIENKDSNLCLLLLTILTDMTPDQWKKCHHYVLEGLSLSMTKQDKATSKVIAWFIVKKCFLSLDKSIRENITDIWPAFVCKCHTQNEVFCSVKPENVELTIEMTTLSPFPPKTFWNIDIKYIEPTRVQNCEGSQIHEHLQNSSGKIHIPDNKSISGVDAKQLFNEHSNLSLIHKSPFKSTGFRKQKQKVIAQSCYQLYCKRKGIIPIGEKHFPTTLNGLQTDVVEGNPHFLSNLKVGNQVGTDEFKRGTLGGFVQVRGDKAFLTCLHVFLSADELASENLSLDDEKTVPVKLYRENDNSHICGKIREIAFEVDNEKETSIDAALVEIPADSIDNFDYVDIGSEKLSYKDIGMKSEYLNNSCVDYRPLCFSKPQPILHTVCVGAVSGFRNTTEPMVYENTDKSIDLETIEETYSKAILDEIKTNVKVVIQSLKQIPIAVSLDDYTIKMNIAQNCDSNISSEIKDIIIAVMRNIYSTMQCTNDVDIDRLIHEHIFCKTQSNFSAIIGDVHMQHAFLKKTGKNMAIKRTSRRVYNQIYISNIPFQPGDSGTCIYVLSPVQGCIGMAIADHPLGGCIVTPIMDILKHFKIRIK